MTTLYEILEINKNATLGEIRDAYKRLSLKWHPDSFDRGNSPAKTRKEADEMFKKIKEACEILSDPQKRSEYDNSTGNAQQWLVNYLKQRFSNQESSQYTISVGGRRTYNPSRVATNPKFKIDSLEAIRGKNLEGPLSLVDFVGLKEIDLSGNRITKLEASNCPNLQVIRCDNNPITNLKFIDKNVEIHFSQDELLRNKKELEDLTEKLLEQIDELKKKNDSLEKERDSRPNITLGEWEGTQKNIQDLQEQNQEIVDKLSAKKKTNSKLRGEKEDLNRRLEELIKARNESEEKLNQEYNNVYFLNKDKEGLERHLKEQGSKLQRLEKDLETKNSQVYGLEKALRKKENELTNASLSHQSVVGQMQTYISSLENKNMSLERTVKQSKEQLVNLKNYWLKKQENELDELVANLKDKLNIKYQGEIDDLIESQEELNKDSANPLAQKQLKRSKAKLTEKLEEAEINAVLIKKKEVWDLQLEFLSETFKSDLIRKLEVDIKEKWEYFNHLLDSAKDKLKKNKLNIKVSEKTDDLEEFLKLQSLIIYSDTHQDTCNYLFERQTQLRQQILAKKKLDGQELEKIRLAKEELAKLEMQKSILVVSSDSNQQRYQAQIQVPPRGY